jgi:hypothetical protein
MRRVHRIAVYTAFVLAAILIFTSSGAMSAAAQTSTLPPSSISVTCAINSNVGSDIGSCVAESLSLSMIALLLSFAFVGIAFMLGQVFGLESLKGWYKSEMRETVKTIAIIVFIFAVLVILGSVAVALAGYPLSQVEASGTLTGSRVGAGAEITNTLGLLYSTTNNGYLSPQLTSAYSSLGSLVGVSLGVGFLKGTIVNMWTPFPVPPLPPFISWVHTGFSASVFVSRLLELGPLAGPGISLLGDIMTLVTLPVITILQIQEDFFGAFMGISLLVLLPLGVLLRAIPIVRGIGGTLIAIAIGIAIVYPMLLVGLNMPITDYMQSTMSVGKISYMPNCGGVVGSLICFASDVGTGLNLGTLQLVTGRTLSDTGALDNGVNAGLSSMNSIYPAINLITTDVLDQILQLILFIFDLIITVAAVNAIAGMLGGKLRTGIGRFKLA